MIGSKDKARIGVPVGNIAKTGLMIIGTEAINSDYRDFS